MRSRPPSTAPLRRAPGRPSAASTDQREALLDAARLAFARHGFHGASLRLIAQQAHVTAALASYYFGDKLGLLNAVLEYRVGPLAQSLGTVMQDAGDDPLARIRAFVTAYTRLAAQNRWLPQLIVREVMNEEGVLREAFAPRFAGGTLLPLRAAIEQAQQEGRIRRALDPAHVVMSLVSLCIFPFVATPLVEGALGVEVSEAAADDLAAHHLAVLLDGIRECA